MDLKKRTTVIHTNPLDLQQMQPLLPYRHHIKPHRCSESGRHKSPNKWLEDRLPSLGNRNYTSLLYVYSSYSTPCGKDSRSYKSASRGRHLDPPGQFRPHLVYIKHLMDRRQHRMDSDNVHKSS